MRHFVFCHGFGFDKSFWKNLSPKFSKEKCTYLELGYLGALPELEFEDSGFELIGVGHSIGVTKLLASNKAFDFIIGLNGFVNFLGGEPWLRKNRDREFCSLRENFINKPRIAMKKFYHRCGVSSNNTCLEKININRLFDDFDFLTRKFETPNNTKILIISARDDIVVPEEVLYDNFHKNPQVKIDTLDSGKHALGFLRSNEISNKIMSFVSDAVEN